MVKASLAFVLSIVLLQEARCGVVINEVLVNEPGSYQSLEWFELYVDSGAVVSLDDYRLTVDEDEVTLPPGLIGGPHGYIVICRRLTSEQGVSFEGRWGDSSGVWGDTEHEAAIGEPVEASFSLRNSGGTMILWRGEIPVSSFAWDNGGDDGVSFERITPGSPNFAPCVARAGSTPGALNSVTPAENDLALTSVEASVDDGLTRLRIVVSNRGANAADSVLLRIHDLTEGQLLDSVTVDALSPGDSASIETTYFFEPMWVHLAAAIPHDDRTANDSLEFWAPGCNYPPVILSEIMPAPEADSRAEWVEILSIHNQDTDISGWRLGDSRKLCFISEDALLLSPGERLVLAWDRHAFFVQHGHTPHSLVELDSWAQLNNGGDTVRLVDSHGLIADAFGYDKAPANSHTFGRCENDSEAVWGESVDAGGTPGETNRVFVAGQSSMLHLSIRPQVFSPDGDGVDDTVLIRVDAPTMDEVTLELYDRRGRLVYDFRADRMKANEYVWHGTDNGGAPLPIGIYIVYCEVDGRATKQAVVIARQ